VAVLDLGTHGDFALRTLQSRVADLLARFPLVQSLESEHFTAGDAGLARLLRDLFNKAMLTAGREHGAAGASGPAEALRTA
jgi:hypothetical protein